ncbi:amino acid/amide ABC transporter membrane protein 2 (HAAT family) [Rhodobacter sp. JA431]|uniref:branched-chain amino acid ABC transporter permease n=1 Tax=Rhodobacter sp. JA431 TaxID=570013 RepID=UPI000BC4F786|nr:branched-chain amino acid ABC transporter permease [Rhodobacter sp. JA431]SOB98034.1 amino acid/amide ABC transporter membrane protein 2 (HAAT family) [Rhodobacter sp. JA431]
MSTHQPGAAKGGKWRAPALFGALAVLFILEGTVSNAMFSGHWDNALGILRVGLISAILALGINIQWGYAGLFNAGVVGFLALGGLAPVLVAMPPTEGAFEAGGWGILFAFAVAIVTLVIAVALHQKMTGKARGWVVAAVLVLGFFSYRALFDPAVEAIQAINPAATGYLGGLSLPTLISWPVGMVLAAGAAWIVGKTALGLRSDYLSIATLGIGEIIVAILKNEEWLARGVLNVNGIPRPWPVPYETDLQQDPAFMERMANLGTDPMVGSTVLVKLLYVALFVGVLAMLMWAAQLALNSPWGRMMRAIRDNEVAASAMGKNVTGRHLQIFILGCSVLGLAGAMMISLDGQMTPSSYNPLRYTFLIWVMVIVGGSGNNWGAVLGGLLIWFVWIKAGEWGPLMMDLLATGLGDGAVKEHLLDAAPHMRLVIMGVILLLVLRFSPRGLLPER